MASGSFSCTISRFSSGVKTFTSPAPIRYAALAESREAPAMFFAPAITRTFPYVPLLESAMRAGILKRSSRSSIWTCFSRSALLSGTKPTSFTRRCPQSSRPGNSTCPSFFSPNVTVTSARTASPITLPLSELMPDGTSTAMTFMSSCPLIHRISFRYAPSTFLERPIPKIASRITPRQFLFLSPAFLNGCAGIFFSTGSGRSSAVITGIPSRFTTFSWASSSSLPFPSRCGKTIFTSYPFKNSILAAATPSAPLFPKPQTDQTVPASSFSSISSAFSATAIAARSIRTKDGIPYPLMDLASNSFISFPLRTAFIRHPPLRRQTPSHGPSCLRSTLRSL